VGHLLPTSATLLGMDEGKLISLPTGVDGVGDITTSIVSCGQCVSPPMSNMPADCPPVGQTSPNVASSDPEAYSKSHSKAIINLFMIP